MTRTQRRTAIGNLLFVAILAAGIAWLLYRTDQERIVEKVAQPYATLRILPDSLSQHPIAGSPHWGLFFSLSTLKRESCAEIIVERFVHKIGDLEPIARNIDISEEIVPAGNVERIIDGLNVRMPRPLGPGDYFMLIRSTCHVHDEDGNQLPLSPPAETFICFRVPSYALGHEEVQRLDPISETCRRDLSTVTLRQPSSHLVNAR